MPRLPWPWILMGVLGVGTLAGGYWLKERQRAQALRAQMLRVHEYELAEPIQRYTSFREKVETWVQRAAWSSPREYVDPRLRIEGLRAGSGLYLRLYAQDAKTRRGIDEGARSMDSDAIASCLGLAPASARGLWEKGAFLLPAWKKTVRKERSVMRLRVIDEVFARSIRSDLPSVLALARSQWFMLVLQLGATRRDHPVDVFLWDVKRDQLLLRSRIQARGLLVPMRISVSGAPAGPGAPAALTSGAATDCSIASQLKARAGAEQAEMNSVPAVPQGLPPEGAAAGPGAAPAGDAPAGAAPGTAAPAGAPGMPAPDGSGVAPVGGGASAPPKSP
jgi:hypothetical protein